MSKQKTSTTRVGLDPTIMWLKSRGLAVNLENWLAVNYPDKDMEELSGEELSGVPTELLPKGTD
jgi:hypothetical protein